MVKRKTKIKNRKTYAIVLSVLILVTIAGIFLFFYSNRASNNSSNVAQTVSDEADDYINLDPPTEQEKSEVNQNKESLPSNTSGNLNNDNESNSSTIKEVSPIITIARKVDGNVEVRSFVPDIYENSGTCTATFTKDGKEITGTSRGVKDATYTRCERILVSASKFNGSGWRVMVSYKSSSAEGSSEKIEVEDL
jgi:cytoskeletal protein RodZ